MDWIQEEIAMRLKSPSAGDQLRNNLAKFTSYQYHIIFLQHLNFAILKAMQTISIANITWHQN